ncbi:transposase [Photorhabdus sp. APURE]|nr:transposase [Photorhabdus aballayi]MCW7546927.1 transposase [Photorhabdus aballayi]
MHFSRRGKSSTGWFYGFKLHLLINDCGELLAVKLTPVNTDNCQPVKQLVKGLNGYVYGERLSFTSTV